MKKKIFVILGNQLFNPKYFEKFKKDHIFFMAEDYGLCTYEKHHKQKILFFLSAMRSFADELEKKSYQIIYKKISERDFTENYTKKLQKQIESLQIMEASLFEIEDKLFENEILRLLNNLVKVNYYESPMFLTKRMEFRDYLSKGKKPFMANFYKSQRIKHKILIDKDNKPLGGKWSFDKENRKKLPKNITLPKKIVIKKTHHTENLKSLIESKFNDHPGNLENFWIGTTRKCAKNCLDDFLENRINYFGDYEDAVDRRDNILYHSALSPLMNIGLLTPNEIIEELKKSKKIIKLNSYEGYVRQVIGWREFIRGIYQNFDKEMESKNFFNHKRKMKKSWYLGATGLAPLDYSIKKALNLGWTHHIERLMILANLMNLSEIHPKQVYKWFMEMFIDSSEWVMVPNVYGMGLFSDGGVFATKPYICGSAYFLKMMDFKKGVWCDIIDGLYWRFIEKNKFFFQKNPRLSMMVRVLEKMKKERKEKIFNSADIFLEENTYVN
ncbi:MAG: cryptochrome/photolyase family protein [Rickettsiales bacterium]|nr:cryptochrome/photolyase family protein [Rickettsiales bacterium]